MCIFTNNGITGTSETRLFSENERIKFEKFASAVLLRPSVIFHTPHLYTCLYPNIPCVLKEQAKSHERNSSDTLYEEIPYTMLQALIGKRRCAKSWGSVLPTNPSLGINPVIEHWLKTLPASP